MPRHSERHFFTNDDGLKLAAIVEHSEGSSRGVFLFSHCFTCSKDLKTIVKLSRRLAELGWTVCRYDFRGIGQSEGNFSTSNFTTNLDDLVAAARWLDSINLTPSFLFGHSFGGAAALAVPRLLSSKIQQQLQGVITLAAPSDTSHLADILLEMNPQIVSGSGDVQIGGKTFSISNEMLDNFRSADFTGMLHAARKDVDLSYLVIHSLSDKTVAYQNSQMLFKLLSDYSGAKHTADVSLFTMRNTDHLLADDPNDIEIVSSVIDRWCQQRTR
jgi:putative redox protein